MKPGWLGFSSFQGPVMASWTMTLEGMSTLGISR